MKISNKNLAKIDENFTVWFFCKKCKQDKITYGYNFCPHCGKKIKWDLSYI